MQQDKMLVTMNGLNWVISNLKFDFTNYFIYFSSKSENLDGPVTVEDVLIACLSSPNQFRI